MAESEIGKGRGFLGETRPAPSRPAALADAGGRFAFLRGMAALGSDNISTIKNIKGGLKNYPIGLFLCNPLIYLIKKSHYIPREERVSSISSLVIPSILILLFFEPVP